MGAALPAVLAGVSGYFDQRARTVVSQIAAAYSSVEKFAGTVDVTSAGLETNYAFHASFALRLEVVGRKDRGRTAAMSLDT